eukprot:CAMPEP_0180791484 /NCGR_PEP_ID=MMETSP1038_2-20121128/53837_1 /TAXON_ID=632150 /ORGANISM="Azadinium spinosum, Strain 3D9" /LENGTH=388 /DNA_ID=CAMNT_0022829633 /DNA_START=65 /DNA_END=1228 /DNA_ORIENTATION=+
MCAGTAWVYYGSELNESLRRSGLDHASQLLLQTAAGPGDDSQDSAMSLCGLRARGDQLGPAVRAFARRAAFGYLGLWIAGLALSLTHAARQKCVARAFYLRHPCLAEFVLNIEGFPPDATDEAKILSFVREVLGSDAIEVSICYDYRSRRERVHELLEKVLVEEEVRVGTYPAPPALRHKGGLGTGGLGLSEEEKSEIRGWLRPGAQDGLRNAGSVFAILPHNYDMQLAKLRVEEGVRVPVGPGLSRRRGGGGGRSSAPPALPHQSTPEWLPSPEVGPLRWVGPNRMYPLVIRDVVCEPPEVAWDHLGLETWKLACRFVVGTLAVALSFVGMAAVVFVPLAAYSINYVYKAGSTPTGMMMTVLGTLVMTANWIMCLLHIGVSSRVGFP